jgi:hypothetical protein
VKNQNVNQIIKMKRLVSNSLIVVLSLGVGGLVSCKKTAADVLGATCTAEAQAMSTALEAYIKAPNDKTKCQAYINAMQKFIDAPCFSVYGTAAERKEIQDDLKKQKC